MRSITNEIYEELNKKKSPVGINRTDVLQNLVDCIYLSSFSDKNVNFIAGSGDLSFEITSSKFDIEKKNMMEKIKASYTIEKAI